MNNSKEGLYKERFTDLPAFLSLINNPDKNDLVLYRGQSSDKPLLPKIARVDPKVDTTNVEKKMLEELRRRGEMFIGTSNSDDWDLMVQAQHFGMATRLLDWSSNPLVALWFACAFAKATKDSYVYVFKVEEKFQLDRNKFPDPFLRQNTRVFKPKLNNSRIIAQSGWFTAHKHSGLTKQWMPLERINGIKESVIQISIPHDQHSLILIQLDILGVNYQTMFPDMEGLCRHINWKHDQ